MKLTRGIPYLILAILLLLPFHRVLTGGGYLTATDSYLPHIEPFASKFPDVGPSPSVFAMRKDGLTQTIPSKRFTREQLRDGRLPLWNPYIFCGTPHQADMYSQVFALTDTPFLYIMSVDAALTVTTILKLLLLGFGMFLLARRFGARWELACIASIAMCFNFQQLHWLIVPSFLSTVLYLPWIFLAWDNYLKGGGLAWVFLCGLMGGLAALGGQMQLFATIWIILFLYTFTGVTYHGKKISVGSVAAIVIAFLSAILIACVQIWPGLEFARLSYGEGAIPASAQLAGAVKGIFLSGWKQIITNFLRLFAPYSYHAADISYYSIYKELVIYLGLLSPAAIAALWRVKRTPLISYLWWVSLVSLILILFNVFSEAFLGMLPFTQYQSLRRVTALLFTFHMALLLPLLLEQIIANFDTRLLRRLKIAAAFGMLPVALYFLYTLYRYTILGIHLPSNQGIYFLIFYFICLLIGAAYFVLLRNGNIKRNIFPAILLLLFFFEIWNYASHQIVVSVVHSDELVSQPAEFMHGRVFRTELPEGERNTPYQPNTGMLAGIYDAQGYFPLNIYAYRRLVTAQYPTVEDNPRRIPDLPEDYSNLIPLLRILRVDSILSLREPSDDEPDSSTEPYYVKHLREGGSAPIEKSWGLSFYKAEKINPSDFYDRLKTGELDLLSTAYITHGSFEDIPMKIPQSPAKPRGTTFTYDPGKIVITVEGVETGEIFMFPENNYPGWQVKVDGESRELLTINGTFLGVQLGEGDLQVEFTFQPSRFRVGLMISAVSFVLIAFILAAMFLSKKRRKSS